MSDIPLNLEGEIERLATLSRSRAVWVQVGQLIDGTSDRARRDVDLVFDAKQIHSVGSVDREKLAAGQTTPDAKLEGVTALPMLIEAHAHAFLEGAPVNFAT